jgi:hypothetical protein
MALQGLLQGQLYLLPLLFTAEAYVREFGFSTLQRVKTKEMSRLKCARNIHVALSTTDVPNWAETMKKQPGTAVNYCYIH